MQVGVDVKCMHTNFGGRGYSGFGDTVTLKNGQISLLTMDYVQVYAYACVYNILLRYQCLAVSNCCSCTIALQNFTLPLSCTTCEY